MIYGYARVSSKEQNLDRQIKELIEAGVSVRNILSDKQPGKDFNRKAYNSLVGTENTTPLLRDGDLLVVYSIDRLGRNYTEIMNQWKHITQELKADIKVLDMPLLDTRTTNNSLDGRFVADLVLQILSYVSEKERENIKIRQRQGIEVAREKGKHLGRPKIELPDSFDTVVEQWKQGIITAVEAYTTLGMTKSSFYKSVKELGYV